MMHMNRVLVVLIALLALALLATPALAVKPLGRVTFYGSGVTGPDHYHYNTVTNAEVRFAGSGLVYPDWTMSGHATFEDMTNDIQVRLTPTWNAGWDTVQAVVIGDAVVTVSGVRMPDTDFFMILQQQGDDQWFSLEVGASGTMEASYRWDLTGIDALNGGQIRIAY
jgi:hypothetical protein